MSRVRARFSCRRAEPTRGTIMATSSTAISGRVVLTGAAGRLGRVLLTTLRAAGLEVLATDLAPWPDCPVPFVRADLCDADATNEVLKGCAAVVHGGAVPGPSATTP